VSTKLDDKDDDDHDGDGYHHDHDYDTDDDDGLGHPISSLLELSRPKSSADSKNQFPSLFYKIWKLMMANDDDDYDVDVDDDDATSKEQFPFLTKCRPTETCRCFCVRKHKLIQF